MDQVSKLSTAGKAKGFVKNIVIIWKYNWATALKERMPAVYLRAETADTEARGWSTCCPHGPWKKTRCKLSGEGSEQRGAEHCHLGQEV